MDNKDHNPNQEYDHLHICQQSVDVDDNATEGEKLPSASSNTVEDPIPRTRLFFDNTSDSGENEYAVALNEWRSISAMNQRASSSSFFQIPNNRSSMSRARRNANETEEMRRGRLKQESDAKSRKREMQKQTETTDDRLIRLASEATNKKRQRQAQEFEEPEEIREERLHTMAVNKRTRRAIQAANETEIDQEARLSHDASRKQEERYVRNIQEDEDDRNARLAYETLEQARRRDNRAIEETEDERNDRLAHEATQQASRRTNRDLQETEDDRLTRLKNDADNLSIRRMERNMEETEEMRETRLKLERESKRVKRSVKTSNAIGESKNRCELRLGTTANNQNDLQNEERHQSEFQTVPQSGATRLWPTIATSAVKHECLTAFQKAMSNNAAEEVICSVCACLCYREKSLTINAGCIPNQNLLSPTEDIPDCVLRLQLDVDRQTNHIIINASVKDCLANAKDSAIIINGMLLCWKGIDMSDGSARICEKCHTDLIDKKLPMFSLSNVMWLGDVPPVLQCLSLPEQKLIALYRHSNCVIKLFSATRNPCLAQTALKGNVITFPQSVSEIARSLPLKPSLLPDLIKIIFVGRTVPNKEQLRSLLTVRREAVRHALLWLHENNILYQDIIIDHLTLDTLPMNDVPNSLWDTLSRIDLNENNNVERSGYTEYDLAPDEASPSGPIALAASGLIDMQSVTTSSNDIVRHLMGRINMIDETKQEDDQIYLIPRGQKPVNEYFNSSFLPGLYPTLFPYGRGGVENKNRPRAVSYGKHLQYLLSYHDRRFETNNSFIFVNFNILQRRAACAKARLLVSRPFFAAQAMEINQITPSEVKTVLSQIESNELHTQANHRVSTLLKQVKTVAGNVKGSNQSRANYRVELHAQIFSFGLPNIFITINPCDLHHPLAMKFAGVDLDIDNLRPEIMLNSQERAAIVASHPIGIAKFFNKMIDTVLKTLIGYNYHQHRSNSIGGVLGKVDAYFGTVEESGRGALHLHLLLWLSNNLTPRELRESIKDEGFRNNLIEYLEDIIKEDLTCFQSEQNLIDHSEIDKQNRTLSSICSPMPLPDQEDFESKKRLATCKLVLECQIHRHTSTCYKYFKKTSTEEPVCRMRYPKEVHATTAIDIDTGEIRMKRAHPMVNNFNEWLLLACRCNIDIKFIWSGADTKALVYYITDYITKRNLSFHDIHVLIHRAVDSFVNQNQNQEYIDALDQSRRLILRCFNTLASQQEISSVQVASYLMGWPDRYCSHTFMNMYLIGIERYLESSLIKLRSESSDTTDNLPVIDQLDSSIIENSPNGYGTDDNKENFELETSADDNHYVLCNKRIDYQLRSPSLSHVPLYWFFAEYRKALMTTSDKSSLGIMPQSTSTTSITLGRPPNDRWLFHSDHPQYSSHLIVRRSFPIIPVLIGPAIPRADREDTSELYARAILTLFHPWTNVLDICPLNQSWSEALIAVQESFTTESKRVIMNIQLLHECKRDRDEDLFQLANKPIEPPKASRFSEPYLVAGVDDVEDVLNLFEMTDDSTGATSNQNANESLSIRDRKNSEYIDSTITNMIRSERFPNIGTTERISEMMNNQFRVLRNTACTNGSILRKGNDEDLRQIRVWQHQLKMQKEHMRRTLLFGLQEEQMTGHQIENEELIQQIDGEQLEILRGEYEQPLNSNTTKPVPIDTLLMTDFVKKFSLNAEQQRVFSITQSHMKHTFNYQEHNELNSFKPEQLLMYIGGAGGCGKSRVIEAISDYLRHYGRLHKLRRLAPSSAAAVGIGGLTIQSMLHEARNKSLNQSSFRPADLANIEAEWRNIDYCLIDEISMVGCYMLARLHKIMTIAKHTPPTVPFGGINMLFLGDFVQYAPVLDRPLYANILSNDESFLNTVSENPTRRRIISEREIQCKVGRALWLQVNKVVFLKQQMRNKDQSFMAMQTRLRTGQCNDDDYQMLMTRVVKPGNKVESFRCPPWNTATMLVFRNEVRTKINNLSVFDHAIQLNQSPCIVVAIDQIRDRQIDNINIRKFLLTLADNKTEGLPGYLPMVPNMPVVITHNIATELHISNGSIGRLISLVYEEDERSDNFDSIMDNTFPWNATYIRKPLYALVELPQCKLASTLVDLSSTIVPIFPESKQIRVDLSPCLSTAQRRSVQNRATITMTRSQLPIVPAYAMTTHKCQGKTLSYGVIDILPPPYAKPDLAQTYVPISRFTHLEGMVILRPFPRTILNQRPQPDMVAELKRLELLDERREKSLTI